VGLRRIASRAMSAIGTKQTSVCVVTMSALEVKRAMDTSRVDLWMAPRTAP
jgi:hypothetical protein